MQVVFLAGAACTCACEVGLYWNIGLQNVEMTVAVSIIRKQNLQPMDLTYVVHLQNCIVIYDDVLVSPLTDDQTKLALHRVV